MEHGTCEGYATGTPPVPTEETHEVLAWESHCELFFSSTGQWQDYSGSECWEGNFSNDPNVRNYRAVPVFGEVRPKLTEVYVIYTGAPDEDDGMSVSVCGDDVATAPGYWDEIIRHNFGTLGTPDYRDAPRKEARPHTYQEFLRTIRECLSEREANSLHSLTPPAPGSGPDRTDTGTSVKEAPRPPEPGACPIWYTMQHRTCEGYRP